MKTSGKLGGSLPNPMEGLWFLRSCVNRVSQKVASAANPSFYELVLACLVELDSGPSEETELNECPIIVGEGVRCRCANKKVI
jgi:hypothetical protein